MTLRAFAGATAMAMAMLAAGCLAPADGPRHPTTTPKPVTVFPSSATLAAVEAKPALLPPLEAGETPQEGWTVDPTGGAAAVPVDPWTPQGPWDQAFADAYATSGRKAAITRPMACVASEIGRFLLTQQGVPSEALERFVNAACGVFAPTVSYQWLKGDVPPAVSDRELIARWRGQLGPDVLDHVPAEARRVGFWAGRRARRAVALVVYDATPVEVTALSLAPDAHGDVVIAGRYDGNVESFAGFANQGRFGVSACKLDPAVPRPQFRATCPMAAGDETAWMQIVYVPPRSVLALPIAQVLARRDVEKPLTFGEAAPAISRAVDDAAAFAPAVVAGLNALRAEAGLAPVRLADAQSAAAARVARQYFAGVLKRAAPEATGDMNTIALGLLAGWNVAGTIRDGSFFSVVAPHTRDAGQWLDLAVALPLGRDALLGRDIEEVALGPVLFRGPDAIGAVACGYRFHHGNDHSADAAALRARLAAARKSLNLSVPAHLDGVEAAIQRELAYVQRGEQSPVDALRESLRSATHATSASVRGYVAETLSVDAVQLPPELVKQKNLYVEIGVTHYKPPGAAWAQLVVVIVYIDTLAIQA